MKPLSLRRIIAAAVFSAAFWGNTGALMAQAPSLAPADAYYITAKTEFGNETFTVIRDGRIEEQFYFVPARPHVAIETKNGKKMPVFELLSYQRAQEGQLKQGGILQLSVQTGISKETETDLLNKIQGKFPLGDKKKKHRLSPVPMKSATISMYDLGGNMLDSAPVKEGVAPIFGNQQFPFMLNLTDLGADTMEALCRGKGGLPVLITYTFQGMTPAGGFKVEVNWDSCYKHFSTDTKLKAQVAYATLTGSIGADFSTVREQLLSNGIIKVTSLANEAMPPEKIDAVLEPILTLITKEMFEQLKAPAQIPPAVAKEIAPSEGPKNPTTDVVKQASEAIGEAASAATTAIPYVGVISKIAEIAAKTKLDVGASFALKDAKFVKKGKFEYVFDRQAIVDRRTAFGGPIGIGAFDKKIQDECISVLPTGRWESAFLMLPPVGDLEMFGVKSLSLSARLDENGKQVAGIPIQAAFYKVGDDAWKDKNNKEIANFLFPLKAVYASKSYEENPSAYNFAVEATLNTKSGKTLEVSSSVPIFNGEMAMAPVGKFLIPVMICGDCLSFGETADEIFVVKGTLKAGKNSFPVKLTADSTSQAFLVPVSEKSVKIDGLTFLTKQGKRYAWRNNGKELSEVSPDLDLMLFDSDWQETPGQDSISAAPF